MQIFEIKHIFPVAIGYRILLMTFQNEETQNNNGCSLSLLVLGGCGLENVCLHLFQLYFRNGQVFFRKHQL